MANNNNNSAKQCFCQTIRTESEEASAITCANCQRAIHLSCANLLPHQAAELQAYYCCSCLPYTGPSIPKPITNSHRHNRVEPNPETLPIQTGSPDFINYLRKNSAISEPRMGDIRKMRGQHLTLKELCVTGFDRPIQIETNDGLEMQLDANLSLENLAKFYPVDHALDCFEVTRQVKARLTVGYLLEQLQLTINQRVDVYLTRLDLSKHEQLERSIAPPRIVRKLSWVDQYYPKVPFRPNLSTYGFVSMENGYVDFHIDVGGTAAWYHIVSGEQTFIFVEPTDTNLELFEKWENSANKQETMFFVNAERYFKVRVSAGETLLIPNGWIYAILTTEDTLMVGGYYLHSISIAQQLRMFDYLKRAFPEKQHLQLSGYEYTCWYAAPNLEKLIKDSFKNRIPRHLSEGVEVLLEKLNQWLNQSRRKESQQQQLVPQAIDCAKIVRDLRRCLSIAVKSKQKPKQEQPPPTPAKEPTATPTTMKIKIPAPQAKIDPEEAKIKDLLDSEATPEGEDSAGGSGLKLKLNMKLAQDVMRQSMDDPYEMPGGDPLSDDYHLIHDPKGKKAKKRKRKLEQIEIAQMVEGRPEDDQYIYLDLETPEENREAIKKSRDDVWRPSTSSSGGSKAKAKPKPATKASASSEHKPAKGTSPSKSIPAAPEEPTPSSSTSTAAPDSTAALDAAAKAKLDLKKFKKGMLTPKQRLAKKLKMK